MMSSLNTGSAEKTKSRSDMDVVLAARAGGDQAFADLVERYAGLVRSVAFSLSGSWQMAEDVAQETFLVVWLRLGHMEDPERFRGWVCGIVRNLVLKKNRRQRVEIRHGKTISGAGTDAPSSDPSPLDKMISEEEARVLWRALERIPEIYRIPLVLFYAEQQSLELVALTLGLSLTSTRKRLSRGRQLVQEQVIAMIESSLSRMGKRPLAPAVLAAIVAVRSGGAAQAAAATEMSKSALPTFALGTRMNLALASALALVVAVPVIRGQLARDKDAASVAPVAPGRPVSHGAADRQPTLPRLALATTGAGAPGGSAAEATREPQGDVLLDLDFESGIAPDMLTTGGVVPGPERAGSRFCVAGGIFPSWPDDYVVGLQSDFRFSRTLTLSFDFWVGAEVNSPSRLVNVSLKTAGPGVANYPAYIWDVPRGAWTHAEIPFTRFDHASQGTALAPLREGDTIIGLVINGGSMGGVPFYLDNVKLVRGSSTAKN